MWSSQEPGQSNCPTTKSHFYPDSRSLDRHPGVQAIESDKEAVKTMAIVSVRLDHFSMSSNANLPSGNGCETAGFELIALTG